MRNRAEPLDHEELTLLDLVDRLIEGGVVIHGDITLAVADVDLVYVSLRALVSSVSTLEKAGSQLPPGMERDAF
jgi:hypothetical protein